MEGGRVTGGGERQEREAAVVGREGDETTAAATADATTVGAGRGLAHERRGRGRPRDDLELKLKNEREEKSSVKFNIHLKDLLLSIDNV